MTRFAFTYRTPAGRRRAGRRHFAARSGLALFLAGYFVLASARALIPGLCTTQAALDQAATPSCCVSELSCAATPREPRLTNARADLPPCAFCQLVHLPTTPASIESLSVEWRTIELSQPVPSSPDLSRDPWDPATRRGPPLGA